MRAAIPLVGLLCGCFGGTQNPSYFPYYWPTGDVIRTHAKPPGLGYFRNFDPKACKIDITPAHASNPTRAQVILIATVYDKDGDARRKRRVEWQLEGPGCIVEVDESGFLPGRGYQVTDKFAVSYTDLFTHTLTRGSNNPRDEVTICPGQTWCVVSCPVEGQTIVTAYAPEIYDWEKRRAFARLIWTDSGFLPAVQSGRETDSSLLERAKADAPAGPSLMLDAQISKAVAVNRESTATITLTNSGRSASSTATVRAVLPEGVDLIRSEPPPTRRSGRELSWSVDGVPAGESKNFTLTLKPSRTGAFNLTTSATTADGLTATTKAESFADTAGLRVNLDRAAYAAVGEKADVKITVSNTGNVAIENAVAWVTPGAGLATGGTSPLEVRIGSIGPNQSRTVEAPLIAERSGKSTIRVDVTADGGLSARGEGTVTVGKAELMVRVIGPETIPVGDLATYEVQVTNAGDLSVSDIRIEASFPSGLMTKDNTRWNLATLAPGEKQIFRLAARGDRLSELGAVTASASGTIAGGRLPTAKSSVPVTVRGMPVLVFELQAPAGPVSVGSRASYRVTVRNRGNGPARDVVVGAEFSPELRGVKASENVGELAAGGSKTVVLEAEAVAAGDARLIALVRSKDLPAPLREEQATRIISKK